MKKHKHHIIPRYMGGSDDPDNIVEVTIEKHAELHYQLWKDLGNKQDYFAWKMLSKQWSISEFDKEYSAFIKQRQREAGKKSGGKKSPEAYQKAWQTRRRNGTDKPWNINPNHSSLKKLSEANYRLREKGLLSNIGDYVRGKSMLDSQKKKLSESAKNRKKIYCQQCKQSYSPAMFARWHKHHR